MRQVTGGGKVAQVYAIRQAIAKSIVAFVTPLNPFLSFICRPYPGISYHQKFVDEVSKREIKVRVCAAFCIMRNHALMPCTRIIIVVVVFVLMSAATLLPPSSPLPHPLSRNAMQCIIS